jgi:threonine synthase
MSAAGPGGAAAFGAPVACAGCGWRAPDDDPFPIRCIAARPGDDTDHVMTRTLRPGAAAWPGTDAADSRAAAASRTADRDPDPFVRYRRLFRAWHRARARGWDDEQYLALVRELGDAVAAVEGVRFRVTPLQRWHLLGAAAGLGRFGGVWVKDETRHVAGSHKARHLMGVMLELLVAERTGAADLAGRPLAIASCGNAALAAAVVARAAGRDLDVFVPAGADPVVLARLAALAARVQVCERDAEPGDPSVRAMRAAVAAGAIPFTVQGPENGLAIEGGMTLGWELADQLHAAGERLDTLVIQVGGGALAAAVGAGLAEAVRSGRLATLPRLIAVQTAGGQPLVRAWERLAASARTDLTWDGGPLAEDTPGVEAFLHGVARHRSTYMWPWETEPHSVAHGLLDDETYDWLAVVRGMLATGGRPIAVDETTLRRANDVALEATGIPVDATGSAGFAGVLELARLGELRRDERIGVLFTGIKRADPPATGHPATTRRSRP